MMLQFFDEQIHKTSYGQARYMRLTADGRYLTYKGKVDNEGHVFVHQLIHSLRDLP
jgi:hypothetical protein